MKNRIIFISIIYLIIVLVAYIYCFPQSNKVIASTIFNTLLVSLLGIIILMQAFLFKMLKSAFKIFEIFNVLMLIMPVMVSFFMILAAFFSLIKVFHEKDFSYIVLLLPTIVVCFSSYKAYHISKLNNEVSRDDIKVRLKKIKISKALILITGVLNIPSGILQVSTIYNTAMQTGYVGVNIYISIIIFIIIECALVTAYIFIRKKEKSLIKTR